MGSRPLIGIPCFPLLRADSLRPMYGVGQAYVRAIERAGGIPVLIPPQSDLETLRALAARVDGLLLPGGGDVDPTLYSEETLPECGEIEPTRDALEIPLAQLAVEQEQPILGICRGLQVLNVARGGTLYQDIATQHPEPTHPTNDYEGRRDTIAHEITIDAASPLEAIIGAPRLAVNSFHHQAIKAPGAGVEVIAWAEDGLAEAIRLTNHPFALAVQYHPEELEEHDPASQRLFAAFIRACQARMERHTTATPADAIVAGHD